VENKIVELLKQLNNRIIYQSHDISDDVIYIYCEMAKIKEMGSHKKRVLHISDIPIEEHRTELILTIRYYYVRYIGNSTNKVSVPESLDFVGKTGRRTKRLETLIISKCEGMSHLACQKYLRENNISSISDSRIADIRKNLN
jgi:hypothetical protein